jgi:hypothetical protein
VLVLREHQLRYSQGLAKKEKRFELSALSLHSLLSGHTRPSNDTRFTILCTITTTVISHSILIIALSSHSPFGAFIEDPYQFDTFFLRKLWII